MEKVMSIFCFLVAFANCVMAVCVMLTASWTELPASTLVFLIWFAMLVVSGLYMLITFWRKR